MVTRFIATSPKHSCKSDDPEKAVHAIEKVDVYGEAFILAKYETDVVGDDDGVFVKGFLPMAETDGPKIEYLGGNPNWFDSITVDDQHMRLPTIQDAIQKMKPNRKVKCQDCSNDAVYIDMGDPMCGTCLGDQLIANRLEGGLTTYVDQDAV